MDGIRPNTETGRGSDGAWASTTMSIILTTSNTHPPPPITTSPLPLTPTPLSLDLVIMVTSTGFIFLFKCFLGPHIYGVISVGWSTLIVKTVRVYIRTLPTINIYVILLKKTIKTNVGDVCQVCKTLQYLIFPGYLCFLTDETQAWYRWDKQFTSVQIYKFIRVAFKISYRYNVENIVITELKIRFLLPDMTIVESEMVVLRILG